MKIYTMCRGEQPLTFTRYSGSASRAVESTVIFNHKILTESRAKQFYQ